MPELAEVETVRNVLKKQILNKKIKSIDVIYKNIIVNNLDEFKKGLIDQEFIDIKRKGKYLIFETKDNYMISHLRMEGKYFIKGLNDGIDKHEHVIFHFDNFDLRYADVRKFGRIELISKNEFETYFEKIGPDANSNISPKFLLEKLNKLNIPIKSALLDQSIIAGLGNIYVDEVLFASKINPLRKAKKLSLNDCENIIKNSNIILNEAIKHKGTTIRSYTSSLNVKGGYQDFLKVHKRENKLCDCGEKITKIKINGRSTYFCGNCQK